MADGLDPYKTLQVDPEAEDEVIQAAYRRLARKYHPDVAPGADAAARMAAINAAWELIGEPSARAAFDRRRADAWPAAETPDQRTTATRPTGTPASSSAQPSPRPGTDPGARHASPGAAGQRPPETVSTDWTSGRSSFGGGFDDSMRRSDGYGAAGPPPGRPSGTVLNFGRYAGWSLGEIARHDMEYIEWLDRAPIGRNYRQELDALLRASGRRRTADRDQADQRGLYRRR
jgi:curved DNA-binding protein CbpA